MQYGKSAIYLMGKKINCTNKLHYCMQVKATKQPFSTQIMFIST